MKGLQLEVSELLPQESLACGNQAFIATLLCDPLMSALPIIEMLTSQMLYFFCDIQCLDFHVLQSTSVTY